MGKRSYILLAIAGLLFAGTGCAGGGEGGQNVVLGESIPAYSAATLVGDTVALLDLDRGPVLLNIWATWCQPCREEMPDLQAIHDSYAEAGLQVVGVSVDQATARGGIERFLEQHGIGFTILHDPQSRISRVFRTTGVPETFLIGADGTLLARWFGPVDPAAVRATIEEVI